MTWIKCPCIADCRWHRPGVCGALWSWNWLQRNGAIPPPSRKRVASGDVVCPRCAKARLARVYRARVNQVKVQPDETARIPGTEHWLPCWRCELLHAPDLRVCSVCKAELDGVSRPYAGLTQALEVPGGPA